VNCVSFGTKIQKNVAMSTSSEHQAIRPSSCLRNIIAVIVILLFLGALLIPAVQNARESANRASCIGQFKFFTLGMLDYYQGQGCFPPAYFASRDGRPAHSWRIMSLFHDIEPLYKQYRFDEPWNSAHNRTIAAGLPVGMSHICPWYHCPCDTESDKLDTSYVWVVGKGTISAGPTSTRIGDITGGTSNTIMVVEMAESGIPWMEPRDLNFDTMSFRINDPVGVGIRSKHPGVAGVGMCDGSVRSIGQDIDPEVVKAMLTIAGGEKVPWPWDQ
jgi:hypothetical protein